MTPSQAFAEAKNLVDVFRDEAAKAKIKVYKVRGNIAVLEGSGGNIAVLTGRDGKVFVDAGIANSRPRLLEAANGLSHEPVSYLINTHWHFDHTDGNQWLAEEGAAVIAHENTHKHLQSAHRVDDWDFLFPSSPLAAIPTQVFSSELALQLNAQAISLRYYQPAHTDSDISVYFANADVLHCGDTFWNGIYPFIDYSTGGSIDGMINAASMNVSSVTDKTIVISGHANPVGNRQQLIAFRDMLTGIRDNVAGLKKEGRNLDEVIAAKPTSAFDPVWGKGPVGPDFFARLVYYGV
ncbi:MBL fold metallo-hydrolase [Caballeronia sp. GAFFF1]|uniref:MBL fold metallo-hydrolase n=1 Tax=Caballeronia sp. GAFFF1 TaxID=2921779 RepID=UPI00202883EC|nr:MBL fold metallo-hydrolase [Caballeronia sp. GAFFF1]